MKIWIQKPIFADTAYILALGNTEDQHHQEAIELSRQIQGRQLLTTDAVLLEVGNALARSRKQEAIAIIEQMVTADDVEIVRFTPQLFDRASALYKTHQDKSWGLVDCISFVVLGDRDINEVLTTDRHFTQAGFQILMQEATR